MEAEQSGFRLVVCVACSGDPPILIAEQGGTGHQIGVDR
jgi:hypothetical protein